MAKKKKYWKKTWSHCNKKDLQFGIKKGYSFEKIQKKFLPFFGIEALKLQAKIQGWKHPRVWTDYELQVLKEGLEKGMSYKQIHQEFLSHRSVNALRLKASQQGYESAMYWTEQDLILLFNGLQKGFRYKQILKDLLPQKSIESLKCQARVHGWKKSKQCQFAFSKNNVPLAFIAGFIQADGTIHNNGSIRIKIAQRDRHLLEYVCDILHLDRSEIKLKNEFVNNQKRILVTLYLGTILGRSFIKHFQLHQDKSKGKVVFPHFLNHQCQKAFLLGLWYGDGVSNIGNRYNIGFLSSLKFLKHLLKYAKKYGFFSHYTYKKIRKIPTPSQPDFDLAKLFFHGRQAILFFRFLAEDEIMNQIPPLNRKIKDLLTCSLPQDNKWSLSEDNILGMILKHRRNWSYKHISTFFRNRNAGSVYNRIKRLKLDVKFPRIKNKSGMGRKKN